MGVCSLWAWKWRVKLQTVDGRAHFSALCVIFVWAVSLWKVLLPPRESVHNTVAKEIIENKVKSSNQTTILTHFPSKDCRVCSWFEDGIEVPASLIAISLPLPLVKILKFQVTHCLVLVSIFEWLHWDIGDNRKSNTSSPAQLPTLKYARPLRTGYFYHLFYFYRNLSPVGMMITKDVGWCIDEIGSIFVYENKPFHESPIYRGIGVTTEYPACTVTVSCCEYSGYHAWLTETKACMSKQYCVFRGISQ